MTELPLDPSWGPHIAGYILGAVVPGWAIARVTDNFWRDAVTEAELDVAKGMKQHNVPIPHLMGILERILYISTLLLGHPEFIALWFTLRTAGGWERWTSGYNQGDSTKQVPGRTVFNIYCIGFAVSLLNALAAYAFIIWITNDRWRHGISVALLSVGLTYLIALCPAVYKAWLPNHTDAT